MPTVSVILTSYNHHKFIREAIESVLEQTYKDFELIIVDDDSKDNSWELINSYKDERIIKIKNEKNMRAEGFYNAIKLSKGKYIAIHHSDDIWMPEKLEKQVMFLGENPNYAAVFTKAEIIDEKGLPYSINNHFYYNVFEQPNRSRFEWLNFFFYNGNALCHPSILIKKECYDECDLYDFGYGQMPDFLKWVKVCLKFDIYIIEDKLVKFRVRDNEQNTSGIRNETRLRCNVEIIKVLEQYKKIHSPDEFLKIFPQSSKYLVNGDFVTEFALAQMCLAFKNDSIHKFFALLILFEVVNDNEKSKKVRELYNYTHMDLIADTGKYDIFNMISKEYCQTATLYVDTGEGFSEEEALKFIGFIENDNSFKVIFYLEPLLYKNGNKRIVNLRFDPIEGFYCKSMVNKINSNVSDLELIPINAITNSDGYDVFQTVDPMYYIKGNIENITHIEIEGKIYVENQLVTILSNQTKINELEDINRNNQAHINKLEEDIQSNQAHINKLEEDIQSKQAHISELETNNQGKQTQISHLEVLVENLNNSKINLIKTINLQYRKKGVFQTLKNWKTSYYIFKSGKFDYNYYLRVLGDNYKIPKPKLVKYHMSKFKPLRILCKSINNPIRHYVWNGAFEGLNPSPYFNTISYLENNIDILVNGINPFYHYIRYGINEQRKGAIKPLSQTASSDYEIIKSSDFFDEDYYLKHNVDVKDAGIDAVTHFCSFGWLEYRNPCEKFEVKYYLDKYPDVKNANINPLAHYIRFGQYEDRKTFSEKIKGNKTIVFVSHSATRTGAPIVLLELVNWFNDYTEYNIKIILLNGGELEKKFTQITDTLLLNNDVDKEKINNYIPYGSLIMINTVVSVKILDSLYTNKGYKIVTYIHELEKNINLCPKELKILETKAEVILGASHAVTENLLKNHSVKPRILEHINAFIKPLSIVKTDEDKLEFKKKNNIPLSATIVVACGTTFFIKNPKGFINVAEKVINKGLDFYFIWIGDGEERTECLDIIENKKLTNRINFIGSLDNTREYFSYCDIFLLPSIEDTFPLVCLEAADCKLPIVCFEDAGGMPGFVNNDCGFVVPYLDYDAMASAVIKLSNKKVLKAFGENAYKKVNLRHTVDKAGQHFKKIIDCEMNKKPLVSVIVPNYNYQNYLRQRLDSIYNQNFKDFEVILLDDSSTDDSICILEEYKDKYPEITVTCYNSQNAGNVFVQWKKGIELAKGDYVWIAEADDFASDDFLKTVLLPCSRDHSVVLSYANSNIVGPNEEYYNSYENIKWLTDIDTNKWKEDYILEGKYEVRNALAFRNTIPNVSAVVFKKEILFNTIDTVVEFKKAGDWLLYIEMLRYGKIAYSSKKLNNHRRHANTVTSKNMDLTYVETFKIQKEICDKYYLEDFIKNKMIEITKTDYISMSNDKNTLKFGELYIENDILKIKNKAKVALYMQGLNYGKGGAEMLLITKANMLSELGYEVFVFNRTTSNNELPFDLNPNVEYYTIGFNQELSEYFLQNDIKICIALGIGHDDSNTLKDLHNNGIKMAYAVHNCVEFFENETPGKSSHNVSTQICDNLIVNMKTYEKDYVKRGIREKKIKIIPNMITKRDTNEHFVPHSRKYIFTAGRLVEQKQQHILIEAFEGVAKSFEDIDLIIAGEGVLRSELQELINKKQLDERVKLIGSIDNLGDYYNGCEFFVLPSKFEGSPLVLFEAASFGKITVVFEDARPFKELLPEEPSVIFVEKMQKDYLEKTLISLLKTKQYEKLSDDAITLFKANEKTTVINYWINLIDDLLNMR